MKSAINKRDGYVLAYVVVVIAVVSLIAVAACTTAVRNYKTQRAALSYTQEKYAAEGIVERFVAEFQHAAVEVAEEVAAMEISDETGKEYHRYHDEVKKAISDGLALRLGDKDTAEVDGIVDGILKDGYLFDLNADIRNFIYNTYVDAENVVREDTDTGYFPVTADFNAAVGDVQVDVNIEMRFSAEVGTYNEKKTYYISGVTFEYTSYNVTMLQEGRTGR